MNISYFYIHRVILTIKIIDFTVCFRCVCDDGWFGPVCSHRFNACDSNRHNCSDGSTCVPVGSEYECDCPAGRVGKHCDRDERLSDVRFLGKRSFLSVSMADLNMQQFSIELEIKPSDEHGVVFFVKHDMAHKKFLSLSLYGGVLELRISVQGISEHFTTVIWHNNVMSTLWVV